MAIQAKPHSVASVCKIVGMFRPKPNDNLSNICMFFLLIRQDHNLPEML